MHHARLAVFLHPALRGLLDATDGRKLVALDPAALEADGDAVVKDVRVDQPLQQAQAGPLGGAVNLAAAAARCAVGLVAPTVPDRSIAEPRHPVLLARAADERVIHLVVGQPLRRLRADERVSALLQEIVAEVQRDQVPRAFGPGRRPSARSDAGSSGTARTGWPKPASSGSRSRRCNAHPARRCPCPASARPASLPASATRLRAA